MKVAALDQMTPALLVAPALTASGRSATAATPNLGAGVYREATNHRGFALSARRQIGGELCEMPDASLI